MNKHIIIGDGRKCLCGIFEGKPLHCSDIIKSIETIKRHGQSWDGGLLARLLETYIVDLGDAPASGLKTETPRTDAALVERQSSVAVDASFARLLETEIIAIEFENRKLMKENDRLRAELYKASLDANIGLRAC